MMLRRDFWSKRIASLYLILFYISTILFHTLSIQQSQAVELLAEYTLSGKQILTNPVSPDGKYFIASGQDYKGLYLYDINTGQIAQTLETDQTIFRHAFSPDGSNILYTTFETTLLKDCSTGEILKDYHKEASMALCYSPDGKSYLASDRESNTISRFDILTGDTIQSYPISNVFTFFIGLSPNQESLLYLASDRGTFVNASTGEVNLEFADGDGINAADITPDFSRLAILTRDFSIHIWNLSFNEGIPHATHAFTLKDTKYQFPTISPNGKYILTGREDKTGAHFIEIKTGNVIETLDHNKTVQIAELTLDGSKAITFSMEDYAYKLWDIGDLELTDIDDWPRYE